MTLAPVVIASFLIGSIPFGYIIGVLFFKTDIRKSGSGNIGAMNALRTIGKGGAVAVLLLDALKGFLPPFLIVHFALLPPYGAAVAALAAVLGHCFSPWLGWKGGKGVATSFGAIFALSPAAGLVAIGGWVLGALITRYSSVGSMLGSVMAAAALWYFTRDPWLTAYGIFAAAFIVYTHRENIARLLAGGENPITL
ncbi:MAG TPA: glycerol-3-phosphate 1-O-acyltransferase PlsY [Candidatus Rubrimentiphilum sp.]|nr:glycerol-3-phosphate 1-O-acyltransferase PlsY [Candidatus Rubrimentiphilum sp.]